MIGIVCTDSLKIVGHSLFNNFRIALQNYFNDDFKEVSDCDSLDNIELLIIVDEHFEPNVNIWKSVKFINKLNANNIRTLVFNFEKIFDSRFPWNADHQRVLNTINNLEQIVSDITDAKILNKKIINKQYLSRDTKLNFVTDVKQDRVLFIGQSEKISNPSYAYYQRFLLITDIKKVADFPLDIDITGRKYTYSEYLTKLASYKYILNPLGTGEFINLRYYEALKVGCIPIQQVTDNMLAIYNELDHGHTFKSAEDIHIPTKEFRALEYYLEDYFEEIKLYNII